MSQSQIVIPQSFVDLFVAAGRARPAATREQIAQRYDLCEDLATALSEHARELLAQLHVTPHEVLQRYRSGLADGCSGISEAEADWVVGRLSELLGWTSPAR